MMFQEELQMAAAMTLVRYRIHSKGQLVDYLLKNYIIKNPPQWTETVTRLIFPFLSVLVCVRVSTSVRNVFQQSPGTQNNTLF